MSCLNLKETEANFNVAINEKGASHGRNIIALVKEYKTEPHNKM